MARSKQRLTLAERLAGLAGVALALPMLVGIGVAAPGEAESPAPTLLPLLDVLERVRAGYPGELVEAELETLDGRPVYEVELRDALGNKLEIVADAGTGEVLRQRAEQDEGYALRAAIVPLDLIVSDAQGRFEAHVLEVGLEEEEGRYVYELELLDGEGRVIEAMYDATSGTLLSADPD
jgi:uncharacterized membrane protein YkoI